MERPPDFEILEYIERPENSSIARFFRSVKKHHDLNRLEALLPLMNLLSLFKKWNEYLDKESIGSQTCEIVLNDMIFLGYNDFEQYVILDILILFIDKIDFKKSSNDNKDKYIDSFKMNQTVIAHKILSYTKEESSKVLNNLDINTPQRQLELLRIYKDQYRHIIDFFHVDVNHLKNNFAQFVESRIQYLRNKYGDTLQIKSVEPMPSDPNTRNILVHYGDKQKLFIKDVAKVFNCSQTHVRRLIIRKVDPLVPYRDSPRGKMYFFYPEIIDWMTSFKQKSELEEAGEVFRRRPKGSRNKRRPRME
jgi:hypothetical protein